MGRVAVIFKNNKSTTGASENVVGNGHANCIVPARTDRVRIRATIGGVFGIKSTIDGIVGQGDGIARVVGKTCKG